MAEPTLEERMLDLMAQADALAVGFLRLDADIRAMARAITTRAADQEAAAAAEAELRPTAKVMPHPRRLTATPPGGR